MFCSCGVCEQIGCSEQSIQHAFAWHADMSTTLYLRTIRLSRVRRLLLSATHAGLSIGDLAALGGFWNWSRFLQSYTDQFGELPSETPHRVQ